MRRLLILSCSQRKRTDRELLPALERYDGPAFRVLRRYLRQSPVDQPDVYILSAEFGLISANRSIPWYDQRMTRTRAESLHPDVSEELQRIVLHGHYRQTFIAAGKDYLRALDDGMSEWPSVGHAPIVAEGGLGTKLTKLRDWLYTDSAPEALA